MLAVLWSLTDGPSLVLGFLCSDMRGVRLLHEVSICLRPARPPLILFHAFLCYCGGWNCPTYHNNKTSRRYVAMSDFMSCIQRTGISSWTNHRPCILVAPPYSSILYLVRETSCMCQFCLITPKYLLWVQCLFSLRNGPWIIHASQRNPAYLRCFGRLPIDVPF